MGGRSTKRLPAKELTRVTPKHVWNALQRLRSGEAHDFGESTDYDVICSDGLRLPPKAIFGLAASEALGFQVLPEHFVGGIRTPCFRALEASGLIIVPKHGAGVDVITQMFPADQEWTEGDENLRAHLTRERASGLAAAKKADFKQEHGRLFCERCGFEPSESYGANVADACIEAHHRETQIKDMSPGHRTKLSHLQCLCANCHRVTHRERRL